jgi:hypothetical protein
MLKIFGSCLLATVLSASLAGCSNVKKTDDCCDDCKKETANNGKAVAQNEAKPNPATKPSK